MNAVHLVGNIVEPITSSSGGAKTRLLIRLTPSAPDEPEGLVPVDFETNFAEDIKDLGGGDQVAISGVLRSQWAGSDDNHHLEVVVEATDLLPLKMRSWRTPARTSQP